MQINTYISKTPRFLILFIYLFIVYYDIVHVVQIFFNSFIYLFYYVIVHVVQIYYLFYYLSFILLSQTLPLKPNIDVLMFRGEDKHTELLVQLTENTTLCH